MDPDAPTVLAVRGLSRSYGRFRRFAAVRDVSFNVRRGEIFGLIGPDGAGKTSIIQMLAGVLRPHAGSASVDGRDVATDAERVKERVGYMPQGRGSNLYDSLTVDENIEFFRDLRELPLAIYRRNRADLLAVTRLEPFLRRRVANLSGGMRQKLALICTLIHLPNVLLLDEPTTGVDPISRQDFWQIIRRVVDERLCGARQHVVHGRSRALPSHCAAARGDGRRGRNAPRDQVPGPRAICAPDGGAGERGAPDAPAARRRHVNRGLWRRDSHPVRRRAAPDRIRADEPGRDHPWPCRAGTWDLYGLETSAYTDLVAWLGLDAFASRLTRDLPTGVRQRVSLLCAVLHRPSIVFLDEPTSGVDPHARRVFWDLIYSLSRDSGVTVLVSTHHMDEAAHCDRLGLMHQGRLIAEGAPTDLKDRSERSAGSLLAIEAADIEKAYHVLRRERPQAVQYGDRIHVRSLDPDADAMALAALFEREATGRVRIALVPLSMDEAFIDLIQASEAAHA